MNMRTLGLSAMLAATFAMAGCENMGMQGNKQLAGTGLGAIGGGLAGAQFGKGTGQLWATGAGVLLGALLGSEIGASLDNADRAAAAQAQQRAYNAPIGQTINWNNPNSRNSGTYTPIRDGYATGGAYCREYQQTIVVGGRTEQGVGTACRQPDGTWKIVNG